MPARRVYGSLETAADAIFTGKERQPDRRLTESVPAFRPAGAARPNSLQANLSWRWPTITWRESYVEPIILPPQPLHILAQQALALVLHHGGIAYVELHATLVDLFPETASKSIGQIIDFMIEIGILWNDEGILGMGVKGEEEFGRRNFETVVFTFDAPLLMTVLYGQKELGAVDPMSLKNKGDGPSVLILAGRHWRVTSHDWDSKTVRAEPSEDKGKAAWFGSSKSLSFDLCRMIQPILIDHAVPATLSKRALLKLDGLSESFEFLKADKTIVVGDASGNGNRIISEVPMAQV